MPTPAPATTPARTLNLDDVFAWHQEQERAALAAAAALEREIATLQASAARQRGVAEAHAASVASLVQRLSPAPAEG